MCSIKKNVAFFKVRSTGIMPTRKGPVQCIRNCSNCILEHRNFDSDEDKFEDLLALRSFDDLVKRHSLWFSQYHTIQYHVGQVEIIKKVFAKENSSKIVYVVAVTRAKDLNFLNMVLDHNNLPKGRIIGNEEPLLELMEIISKKKSPLALPIQLRSCVTTYKSHFLSTKDPPCFGAKALRDQLEPVLNFALKNNQFNLTVVPVAITKEHDGLKLYGLGSVCVQILEPYSLRTYISRLDTSFKSTHFVQHLYHDVAVNAVLFPSHLVAFLSLYLERDGGEVRLDDLIKYMDWFRKTAIDYELHLGFTGNSQEAIQHAFMILKNLILFKSDKIFQAKDIDRLSEYANIVTPSFAYFGLIAKAILMEYNNMCKSEQDLRASLASDMTVRVEKMKVVEICKQLAEFVEQRIPCRRPCRTVEANIDTTLNQMQVFGKYLRIEEPKKNQNKLRGWAGELEDDDEDYYLNRSSNSGVLKTWIVLTQREYRLDRLNLFMNAIGSIF